MLLFVWPTLQMPNVFKKIRRAQTSQALCFISVNVFGERLSKSVNIYPKSDKFGELSQDTQGEAGRRWDAAGRRRLIMAGFSSHFQMWFNLHNSFWCLCMQFIEGSSLLQHGSLSMKSPQLSLSICMLAWVKLSQHLPWSSEITGVSQDVPLP